MGEQQLQEPVQNHHHVRYNMGFTEFENQKRGGINMIETMYLGKIRMSEEFAVRSTLVPSTVARTELIGGSQRLRERTPSPPRLSETRERCISSDDLDPAGRSYLPPHPYR